MAALSNDYFIKYVQGSDFVEQQLGIDSPNLGEGNRLLSLIYATLDLMNMDQLCMMLL